MKRGFFVFAAGWAGAALVLLRISVAAFLITVPVRSLDCSTSLALVLDGVALMIAAGIQTRITALLAAAVAVGLIIRMGGVMMPLAAHLLDCLVLAMAGPGAYSIDARLFGRRIVHLPE